MARKIMAVILQPVYDADGKLLYQPGDQLAEDHRLLKSIPGGTFRHVIVEGDDKPTDKPAEPKPAKAEAVSKGTAK